MEKNPTNSNNNQKTHQKPQTQKALRDEDKLYHLINGLPIVLIQWSITIFMRFLVGQLGLKRVSNDMTLNSTTTFSSVSTCNSSQSFKNQTI